MENRSFKNANHYPSSLSHDPTKVILTCWSGV